MREIVERSLRLASASLLLPLLVTCPVWTQHHGHPDPRPLAEDPASVTGPIALLLQSLGDLEHPVTTSSPRAQLFFNPGLRLAYGFNHQEALRAFKEAARLDPDCAMAYWGWALVLGPNINLPMREDVVEQAELRTGHPDGARRQAAALEALATSPDTGRLLVGYSTGARILTIASNVLSGEIEAAARHYDAAIVRLDGVYHRRRGGSRRRGPAGAVRDRVPDRRVGWGRSTAPGTRGSGESSPSRSWARSSSTTTS
jgi:hypothetical protein